MLQENNRTAFVIVLNKDDILKFARRLLKEQDFPKFETDLHDAILENDFSDYKDILRIDINPDISVELLKEDKHFFIKINYSDVVMDEIDTLLGKNIYSNAMSIPETLTFNRPVIDMTCSSEFNKILSSELFSIPLADDEINDLLKMCYSYSCDTNGLMGTIRDKINVFMRYETLGPVFKLFDKTNNSKILQFTLNRRIDGTETYFILLPILDIDNISDSSFRLLYRLINIRTINFKM